MTSAGDYSPTLGKWHSCLLCLSTDVCIFICKVTPVPSVTTLTFFEVLIFIYQKG